MFFIGCLFLMFQIKYPSASAAEENTATLFYCDAPEMFCGATNLPPTFRQHEVERRMTDFKSFL